MDVEELAKAERIARLIEVVYLPAYSAENARYDGPTVPREEVRRDLEKIIAELRSPSA